MDEVVLNANGHSDLWLDVARGKSDAIEHILFDGYTAAVDFPASGYYKDVVSRYPQAKVILTTRDFEKWYKSVQETIWVIGGEGVKWYHQPALYLLPFLKVFREMNHACIWDNPDILDGRFADKEYARRRYDEWVADVKATVPADKLLVWDVKMGCTASGTDPTWVASHVCHGAMHAQHVQLQSLAERHVELPTLNHRLAGEPLCKFLGKPVPAGTFPHSKLTDGETLKQAGKVFTVLSALIVFLAPISVPLIAALWLGDGVRRFCSGFKVGAYGATASRLKRKKA
jgi:hypothetical protein